MLATLQQILSEVRGMKEIVQNRPPPAPPEPVLKAASEEQEKASQEDSPPPPPPTPQRKNFFSSPYNALAYGFFRILKEYELTVPTGDEGDDSSDESFVYGIVRQAKSNRCEIHMDDLEQAVSFYVKQMKNTRGDPFAKNLYEHITAMMSRNGWIARRETYYLDRSFGAWFDRFHDFYF